MSEETSKVSRAGQCATVDLDELERMVIHISYAGPDIFIIDRHGKKWKFEDHRYCGPSVLGRNGDPLANQPPESSPFWEAVDCWYQQGKVTETISGRVFAKRVKPTMPKMRHPITERRRLNGHA